jgi:hypothetical protein
MIQKSNNEIKLHNLKGELRFLLRLKPDFKNGCDFLIDSIERCTPGREEEMHDKIKNIIHQQHEEIRNEI